MNIPDEKFAELIKKATSISEKITENLANELKISSEVLKEWADEKRLPGENDRFKILQDVIAIMLNNLNSIKDVL